MHAICLRLANLQAEKEGVELLDKTVDGSQFKLSMKIPGDLAGRLLGINGEQIQVASRPPSPQSLRMHFLGACCGACRQTTWGTKHNSERQERSPSSPPFSLE